MPTDRIWSIVAQVSFLCAVGLVMTLMSVAAIDAASMGAGPMCGLDGCVEIAVN